MLATSNEIIAAWLNHSRQLSIRVKVNDVTYGSEEITSLSFDSGSISGEVFQIGSTYMNSVQIVFPSIIESIAEDIEVIPELGVMVNGSYEYTKLGHFYVDDFDRNKNNNTTSITATDKMRFMEGEYVSKLTYPKAYREVALDIANSAGVEVNTNSFASLGIGAINKPEGYTHRQAIGLIAQFEGGFASFNRNGELEIRRLAPTTFEITPESYLLKGFTKNESSYRIGGISVKTGEEETDVIRVGSTNGSQVELENKVMTQTLLNQIWELVKTLNYFPYELKWRGCPPLEAGDWIYIEDKDGTKYSVPNLSYSITFNGGMSAESKATTSSTSQATYKYRGSLNQKIDYLDSVLSANKWNTNYYGSETPENPKEGDIWFKPNGQDTEIWVYKNVDGVLKWTMEISSAGDPELLQAIEDVKQAGKEAQLAAKDAKEAADDAKQAGEDAKAVGAEAKAAAENAGLAAADAKAVGADAKLAAEGAKEAADDAKEAGEAAQVAANEAKDAGDTALEKVAQAEADITNVKETVGAHTIDLSKLFGDFATIGTDIDNINTAVDAIVIDTGTMKDAIVENETAITDAKSIADSAKAKADAVEATTRTITEDIDGITETITDIEETATSTTKTLNEVKSTVDGQVQTIATVKTTADSALSKSNTNSNTIDGIQTTLTSTKTTADSALSIANVAKSTADGNTSTITSVSTTATSALSKANTAQSTADGNTSKITAVTTTANSALNKANTLEETVDGVTRTIASIETDFSNLSIGVRNYFSVEAWKVKPNLDSIGGPYMEIQLEPNTSYTLSTNIPERSDGVCEVFFFKGNDTPSSISNGVSKTKSRTIITNIDGIVKVAEREYSLVNGTYWIMLSKGNKTADWSPAPEDLATVQKVNTISETVDGHTQLIASTKTTADSALSKANTAQSTADGNTSKITSVTTTANSALSKANTLEETVDGVTRTITSVEESLSGLSSSGSNLIFNSGFESDFIGWIPSEKSSIVTTTKHTGKKSLAVSAKTDGSGSIIMISNNIPVTPGRRYELSYWYKTTADADGTSNNQKMRIADRSGTYLNALGWDGVATDWTYTSMLLYAATDVYEWQATLQCNHTKGTVYWDDISIVDITDRDELTKKINTVSSTVDGNTQLIATTKTTADSALTKANTAQSTADGNTSKITATTTTANTALSTANTAKSTADGNTSKITAVTTTANSALAKATSVETTANGLVVTVGKMSSSGTNLITNGGFENDTTGWTSASGFTIDSTETHSGSNALKIDNTGSSGRAIGQRINIPVIPGHKYEVSYWVKTTANANGIAGNQKLRIANSSGSLIYAPGWDGALTEWTQIKQIYTAPSSGGYEWKITLTASHSVGTVWWDDIAIVDVTDRETTAAQLSVLSDQVDIRVEKSGVINAINVSTEGTAITGSKLTISALTQIDNAVIKTAHIADLAVSNGKIANLSVTEGKIGSLAVTNAKIADLAVTTAKIGDAAITNAKIGNLAVSEAKIASLAVTEAKVGDAAITTAKIGNLAVSEAKIADLAVSSAKIANLAVTETKIGDAAITNAKIGNLAVSTAKIADAAITDAKIGNLSATKITTGTLNAANVNIINLNASNIVSGTISGANLSINLATGSVLFSKGKIQNINETFYIDIDNDTYYSEGYTSASQANKAMVTLRGGTVRTANKQANSTERIESIQIIGNSAIRTYVAKTSSNSLSMTGELYNSELQTVTDMKLNYGSSSGTRYGNFTVDLYQVANGGTASLSGMPTMSLTGATASFYLYAPSKIELITGQTLTLDAKRTDINSGGDIAAYGGLSLGNDSTGGRVWSLAIYNRTYAAGNGDICITTAGTLGRKTSARKYKADIQTANDVIAHAKEFLTIQPASWYDKKDYANGTAVDRFYGFIADEFHEKGLTEVVYYGNEGQVEGLAYDRLTMYQNVILNDHEQEIKKLKQEVLDLQTKVQELEAA